MRKTLKELACYLKTILVPEAQEAYAINPDFLALADEAAIRAGVLAFRAFLDQLYDTVAAEGDSYDAPKKIAHEYENRTTLSGYYPFLYNVRTMLTRIGYHGVPAVNTQSLACDGNIFDEKVSVVKSMECLRFLAACGVCFDGIDINEKKQNLSSIKMITVSYPNDPAMMTGLKVMATAEINYGTLVNQDIFMRCDYRALMDEAADAVTIVRDAIRPLTADIQDFILELHRRYLDQGLTCVVEIKGFHIHIKYCYKRKDVWGLNASLNNGLHINVKAVKTEEYAETIKTFSPVLRELIAKGYGCGRKREIGRCDGGCRGIPIPLDESVLTLRDDIVTWLDREVSCLRKK